MSGTENLKGFDYQITFSFFKILQLIMAGSQDVAVHFESLNEDEEDLNIIYPDHKEYYQVKKRNEGYHWAPTDLKKLFASFLAKDDAQTQFFFVTNGTANPEVKALRLHLRDENQLSAAALQSFQPENCTEVQLKALIAKTSINTLFFQSGDDEDPAATLREQVKKLLFATPFQPDRPVDVIYPIIWKFIYDCARTGKSLTISKLESHFKHLGLTIQRQRSWLDLPAMSDFEGRTEELKAIAENINESPKFFLYGINGIGKSWLLAKLLSDRPDKSKMLCWIAVSSVTSIESLKLILAHCLFANGHDPEAGIIREVYNEQLADQVINTLKTLPLVLVFDSINSANSGFKQFVQELVENILAQEISGGLIISSTERLFSYRASDLEKKHVGEFCMSGFTFDDCRTILSGNYGLGNEDIAQIHQATGGHPMSIRLLKKLLSNTNITPAEIALIKEKTIEEVRDWVIDKTIARLSPPEKDHLIQLSVIDGTVSVGEAELLLGEQIQLKYLLQRHRRLNLLSWTDAGIVIHDVIREAASNILTTTAKISLYQRLLAYHFAALESERSQTNNVLYETIFKWGDNLNKLYKTGQIPNEYRNLFELDDESLDGLWAIMRYGYPFDYLTEDLSSSKAVVSNLKQKKLIKKSKDPERQTYDCKMLYDINQLDYWQECVITYLCLSRGISDHIGYVSKMKPNYAYYKQAGVICLWEHCIEHMPLPPLSQEYDREVLDGLKTKLEAGDYKNEEEKIRLQQRIEEGIDQTLREFPDWEMEEKSCPIFGHCCPGGKEQADICRAQETMEDS